MATIKSYTSLQQSRKLAEILPLESADMHYNNASIKGINYVDEYRAELMDYNTAQKVLSKYLVNPMFEIIPCWSLASLLAVLPDELEDNHFLTLDKEGKEYCCCYEDGNGNSFKHKFADNPVDACVAMIEKLNELNLL